MGGEEAATPETSGDSERNRGALSFGSAGAGEVYMLFLIRILTFDIKSFWSVDSIEVKGSTGKGEERSRD